MSEKTSGTLVGALRSLPRGRFVAHLRQNGRFGCVDFMPSEMPYLCAVVDALSQHQPSLRGISAPGRLCRRSYAIARGDSAASQSGAPVSRLQCWPHLPFNVLSLPSCHGTGCNGGVRCFHQRLLLVQRQLTPISPNVSAFFA